MATAISELRLALRIVGVLVILLSVFACPASAQPIANPVNPVNLANPAIFPQIAAPSDYPTDPPRNIPWSADYEDLSDVIAAFNSARSSENVLLGTFLKPMVAPTDAQWAQMSEGERVLWLVNEERVVRGLAPLQGLETNVNEVAQGYATWLLANNQFDHEADGHTPWQRLDAKPAIAACHDFLSIAENLYWQGTTSSDGIPLVVEQAVYALIYVDASSQWGHRHAILWTPYTENNGAADREGYLGVGHSRGGFTDPDSGNFYNNTDIIVMNFFDPCATWVEAPPVVVPPPPSPEPVDTPIPPPQTHAASGKTTVPAWQTINDQPFESDTWPGDWQISDANGSEDGEYKWIAARCNVYEGEYSGMAAGGGTDGMPLGCNDPYPNNARSWMIYGPFGLEDAISAMVQAKVWVYTESGMDELCMMISTDGQHFSGTCFSGNSNGWVDEQLDLSHVYQLGNLVGKSNLYVGFAFLSDESVTREFGGAYVDNITLSQGVMSPGSALYGVTITTEDGHATITDQDGDFSLVGLSPGNHLLTPSKEGYQFHPSSLNVDLSGGDVGQIPFIGTPTLTAATLPYSLHLPLIRPR